MVTETPNLKLKKPAGTDLVDISQLNANADILDTQVAGKLDKSGGTLTGPVTLAEGDGTGILIPPNGTINDTHGGTLFGLLGGNFQVGYGSYPTILRGNGIRTETPFYIHGGDGQGLLIPLDGNMNVEGTSNTVLGFLGGAFTIGNGAYGLNIRGSATRPQYNSSDLAMLSDVPSIAGLATEEYVNGKVSSVYKVQGSCTTAELASKAKTTGDVWNLTDAGQYGPEGTNVVYNGTEWDALGGTIDLSGYAKKTDIPDVSGKLDKSGGTMTGALSVPVLSNSGKSYLTGTVFTSDAFSGPYVQVTADVHAPNLKGYNGVFIRRNDGYLYYRTFDEMKEDLGISALETRVTALENIPNANGRSY